MCRAVVPEFVTVTFRGVLVPCVVVPKSGLLGFTTTADDGAAAAFPWMFMTCGESGASSMSVTAAVRSPAASGVKVTFIVQAELAGIAALQVGLEELKSLALAPAIATLEM
jgi:hypothetical protein